MAYNDERYRIDIKLTTTFSYGRRENVTILGIMLSLMKFLKIRWRGKGINYLICPLFYSNYSSQLKTSVL